MAKNPNQLILGDWNAICDQCGFKYKASDMMARWDGNMVCRACWEPRHPQDFIRSVPDQQRVAWVRPAATDTFVEGSTCSTSTAIPGWAIPGCAMPSNTFASEELGSPNGTFNTNTL